MAIVKFGVTVVGARGTIGGITYSANKSGPYAKAWSKGAHPSTSRQTNQQSFLAQMPTLWQALSGAEQLLWDIFAALPAQDLTNSLGETYHISGFGWFCKVNIRLLVMGRATRTAVPTQPRPSAPSITDLEFPFSSGETAFVQYASAEFDPDFDLVLEAAQGSSLGRHSPPTNFLEVALSQDPDDIQTGFAEQYFDRFGLGNTGYKGFLRLYRQTTDGLRSGPGSAAFRATDGADYTPAALAYDGLADYALRGGDLTGNANGKMWSEVGWFKIDGGAGTTRIIRSSTSNRWQVSLNTSNQVTFRGEDAGSVAIVDVRSASTFPADSSWHSYAFSVDTATQIVTLAIDGAHETPAVTNVTLDATIDFTVANHSVGASTTGGALWDGCISSLWAANDIALDFSNAAVRAIFWGPTGRPLDLGDSGQLPTGTPPILYFPDGDASNNVGSGGDFTNQGASNACATSP